MTASNALQEYLALLQIRRKYGRRDSQITGGVFVFGMMILIGGGMLGGLEGISGYLIAAMVVAFGLGFLMTWTRLTILNHSIEMLETMQRVTRETAGIK
ncbi:MAG: hypothetical protein M1281_10505 [Chloroflexi bacterium]|nr:hypothetical protein [Chloroflexota bacterium]